MTLGRNDTAIKKSEFVANTQSLSTSFLQPDAMDPLIES